MLAGVAIADAWKSQTRGTVSFVGAKRGIEEKLVPRAGYPLHLLNLGSLKGVGFRRQLTTLAQLPGALLQSAAILLNEKPRAVVGVGGYASGPLVLVARLIGWIWGVRVAILEQNAVPGFTNRILGRVAHRVFSAFPGLEDYFPGSDVVVTGNPVREAIQPLPSAARDPFTIFVFGGSQGALGVNTLVLESLGHLGSLRNRIRWIHQTGEKDFERVQSGHQNAKTQANVQKFIYEMPASYAEASLLICRAGSSTLAEVAAVGRAAILIPFPNASDDHQQKNAEIFARAGAALVLKQVQSQGADLAAMIRELIENPKRLDGMENAVRQFYRPHAARETVQALLAK